MEVRDEGGREVLGRGAVGVIERSPADPWHSYRVRFVGGEEATLKRTELAVLAEFNDAVPDPLVEHELDRYVIYRCVIGSRAYGLEDDRSDTDRRGIYLPPADLHWSLYGVPEQLENSEAQECYWELQKFVVLALKANPNILECLYTPLVEHADETAGELLAMREKFLSKLVYATFNGYVLSQFKKIQGDLRNRGEVKWKHVMHLLRLLLSGIATLREGRLSVHVGEHRERLRAIKLGEIPYEELERWRLELHREFDEAAASTRLPERPDYAAANALLLRARRRMTEIR